MPATRIAASSLICCLALAVVCRPAFAADQTAPDPSAQQPSNPPPQQPPPVERPHNPTQEIAGQTPEGNSLAVGPAKLRVGGFLGLTGFYRSTNSGGGPATSFGAIPYSDKLQGNVSEARLTAQSSRISLRMDADFPEGRFNTLAGYVEMDFVGTVPGTLAVTANGAGLRLRLGLAEVVYSDAFYLAAGQAYSLMTPAKDQLSIWPSDSELTQAVDLNFVPGLVWGRIPQVRLAWRPSRKFNWAVSVENPEQQITSAVKLPRCCSSDIAAQSNTGSDGTNVPNLMPDFLTRVALNPVPAVHLDVGGVFRVFRHTLNPYDESIHQLGGGASVDARVNATKLTKLIGQFSSGSGMGRYIGGVVPDVTFDSDGSIQTIGTTSWVGGVEQTLSPSMSLSGYYSGVTADNSFAIDSDGSYIGFGYPGSPDSNNKSIKEATGTFSYLAVKAADRGSVQFNVQVSWLKREPWAERSPPSANAFMFFAQIRYNLP